MKRKFFFTLKLLEDLEVLFPVFVSIIYCLFSVNDKKLVRQKKIIFRFLVQTSGLHSSVFGYISSSWATGKLRFVLMKASSFVMSSTVEHSTL